MQPADATRAYQDIVSDLLAYLSATGTLTDTHPGSVVRTLTEAFAREMVEAYAQLRHVYRSGHIDTAEGGALDQLVALLDVERASGQAARGFAVFVRDQRVNGSVRIGRDQGILVTVPASGRQVRYHTAEEVVLREGRDEASVAILSPIAPGQDPADVILGSDDLGHASIALDEPIAGIATVRIAEPTAERGHNESDEGLRDRVKGLIAAAGGGTAKAIENAVLATGRVTAVQLRDAMSAGSPQLRPGELELVVDFGDGDPNDLEALAAIERAVLAAKGPGILVRVRGVDPVDLRLRLHLIPANPELGVDGRTAILESAEQAVRDLINDLGVGDPLIWNKLVAALLGVDGVEDIDLTRSSIHRDGVAEPQPITRIAPGERTRLVLANEIGALAIELGERRSVFVHLSHELPFVPQAERHGHEEALATAFSDHLRLINETTGARSLTVSALTDALRAVVPPAIGSALAPRLRVYDQTTQATVMLGGANEATEHPLAAEEFLRVDPQPPEQNWQEAP